LLRFAGGDTLLLDGGSSSGKRIRGNTFLYFTSRAAGKSVQGVRIIFDRNTPCCIRASGSDRFRKKRFYMDTVLCLSSSIRGPLVFWNPLRQRLNNEMSFNPEYLQLSNAEFERASHRGSKKLYRKTMRKMYAAVSHEYNAVTGRLTPLQQP
jgi:hypothetical protein